MSVIQRRHRTSLLFEPPQRSAVLVRKRLKTALGGTSKALTLKPCGRNLDIPTSRRLKSTRHSATQNPTDAALASTRLTGNTSHNEEVVFIQ